MADDYYQILGVSRSASESEIQKAYRRLARKHHPDLADDKKRAKETFQKIQQAYDVLSDLEKRKLYDQLGPNFESYANASRGDAAGAGYDFQDIFGGAGGQAGGGVPLEEILKQFGFRGSRSAGRRTPFEFENEAQTPHPSAPPDRREDITVPFNIAIVGGKYQLSLSRPDGSTDSISLSIPPGVQDGNTLRLRGQGDARRDGVAGDLIVRVKVASHPVFTRQGKNLLLKVPISVREAVLGAKIDLPTPHGQVALTIPPRVSSGRQMRLKGMGVRPKNQSAGDLIAELQIVLPEKFDGDQEQQLQQLAESLGDYPCRQKLQW